MNITQDLQDINKLLCDYGPIGHQESFQCDNIQIQEDAIRYLDRTNQLIKIEKSAQEYRKVLINSQDNCEIDPPFRFTVEIDFSLLATSALLYNALLKDPLTTQRSIHDAVLHAAMKLGKLPNITDDQVEVPITLKSFHQLKGRNLGLSVLHGILISRTAVKKYIRSAFFRCPSDVCVNSLGSRVPGYLVHRGRLNCSECGLYLVEDARGRVIGEHVIGLLIHQAALQNGVFRRFQAAYVSFQDEMTDDLELGAMYDVAGYSGSNYFHAWSVSRQSLQIPRDVCIKLPESIEKLRDHLRVLCPNSPWIFVFTLASQLAHHLFPVSTFLNLKMGVLLSLASLGGSCPVPILALGTESLSAHLLLFEASKLAPRSLSTSEGLQVCGSERGEEGNRWSEAGALLLAGTGVCYLGDWAKFRLPQARTSLLAAVESKTVTLDIQSGVVPQQTPRASFPLKSAVWTYWTRNPRVDSQPASQTQLRTLVHVFGIPFLADVDGQEEQLTSHILQSAVSGSSFSEPNAAVPVDDLRELITVLAGSQVQLEDQASELIQSYFVACRRVRPHCLPVGAIATITALSEAHARLSLHSSVTCSDVLAVLYLYEESIDKLFGQSCLMSSSFHQTCHPAQVNEKMQHFAQWLENYIKSVLGNSVKTLH